MCVYVLCLCFVSMCCVEHHIQYTYCPFVCDNQINGECMSEYVFVSRECVCVCVCVSWVCVCMCDLCVSCTVCMFVNECVSICECVCVSCTVCMVLNQWYR